MMCWCLATLLFCQRTCCLWREVDSTRLTARQYCSHGCILARRWFDGEHCEKEVEQIDRWTVQCADTVLCEVSDGSSQPISLKIHQKPRALAADKMSVGAVNWDGAFAMVAYLGQLPRQLLLGARVVELGAGPGLPGLFAAACGAFSTITDLAKVTPLIEENIRANSVAVGNKSLAHSTNATLQGNDQEHAHNCKSTHTGRCVGEALQWGTDAGLKQAQVLGSRGVNYVIACDTCYIDPGDMEGHLPRVTEFMETCAALMGPQSELLLAQEPRASDVRSSMLQELQRWFENVEQISSDAWSSCVNGCDHIELYRATHKRVHCEPQS